MTPEDVGHMIRQAILAERKRLGAIIRAIGMERGRSAVSYGSDLVTIAEEIENAPAEEHPNVLSFCPEVK